MKKRVIPASVLEHWAMCFEDGCVHDAYAEELADLLKTLASNPEILRTYDVEITTEEGWDL